MGLAQTEEIQRCITCVWKSNSTGPLIFCLKMWKFTMKLDVCIWITLNESICHFQKKRQQLPCKNYTEYDDMLGLRVMIRL